MVCVCGFQVSLEMLSSKENVIHKATQSAALPYRSFLANMVIDLSTAPLAAVGLYSGTRVLRLRLLSAVEERRDEQSKTVQVTISSRYGSSSIPQVR